MAEAMVGILNPAAAGGRAARLRPAVEAFFREHRPDARLLVTEAPGHAATLAAEAARAGARTVVAIGGDGTVHEIVNGLFGGDLAGGASGLDEGPGGPDGGAVPAPSLALIPAGTGNDFARTAGIPLAPHAAMQALAAGRDRRVDLGRAGSRYFVNIAGVGFDAEVAAELYRRPKRLPGFLPYVIGAVTMLARYAPTPVEFDLDGVLHQQRVLLLAVGNARYYGGGMMLCPDALLDDGLFDVCVGGDLGKLETLGLLLKVFKGAHVGHPRVAMYRARTVEVRSPAPLWVHADGEIIGRVPVAFTCLPGALTVKVPG